MRIQAYRRRLWESVSQHILPCLKESGRWNVLLAEPPFVPPAQCAVTYHPGKPLSGRGSVTVQSPVGQRRVWQDAQVHSTYAPYFGFVLDGEIDFRVGITKAAAQRLGKSFCENRYAVISIPRNTFFVVPPHVPHGQGLRGHWERPHDPPDQTRIFWLHFFAPGVRCHESGYEDEEYVSQESYFLPDAHLLPAASALIAELRRHKHSSPEIVHSLLSFVGHSVARDLRALIPQETMSVVSHFREANADLPLVEQACAYIESHYQQHLSVKQIATHCFVSPSHLSRLFQSVKKMTLFEYITQLRLSYACTLLQESRLGIKQIGAAVGYPNRSHFCQIFTRHFHCSPLQFRNKQ